MVARLIAVAMLAALWAAPAAHAALPLKGAELQAHDHYTPGSNWHVQVMVSKKDPQLIDTLIVYFETCKSTILRTKIPIDDTGFFAYAGKGQGRGIVQIIGAFTGPETIQGRARILHGRCDTGPKLFTAYTERALGQHTHGPAFPDVTTANIGQLRQAQAMRRFAWRAAKETFPTYQSALAQGYRPSPTLKWRPMIFHLRNVHYAHDGVIFNSRRPESLVYWWRPDGDPILLGLMFRVPKGDRPTYAGPIPIYPQHFGKNISMPMTHVWLTDDLRSAWANCAPIPELEAALPEFEYADAHPIPGGPGSPCPG